MVTFKNTDVSSMYNVSNPTVMRWIEAAAEGNNNLQIERVKNKFKIVKNLHNESELLRLSRQSAIFKNKIQKIEVSPNPELYKVFNENEVIELINDLKTKKSIPLKFSYLNGGAEVWDNYIKKGLEEGTYIVPKLISDLLDRSLDFILSKSKEYKTINIVDIGSGNAVTVRAFLEKLLFKDKIINYIPIDISQDLLEISKQNIESWFPEIQVIPYKADIEKHDIASILFNNKKDNNTINIALFLGGTLGNVEDRIKVWKNLRESLDDTDLLVVQNKLDWKSSRSELNHTPDIQGSWIPKMLGIQLEFCDYVKRYDEDLKSRIVLLKLDKDYTIKFNVNELKKETALFKGEEILIWRHHMSTVQEILEEITNTDLNLVHSTTQEDLSNILVICQAKKVIY